MHTTLKRRTLLPSLSSPRLFEVKADVEPIMEEQVCSLSFMPDSEHTSDQESISKQWSGQESPGLGTFGQESPQRQLFSLESPGPRTTGQNSPRQLLGQASPKWKKPSFDENSLSSPTGRPNRLIKESSFSGTLSTLPDSLVVTEDGKLRGPIAPILDTLAFHILIPNYSANNTFLLQCISEESVGLMEISPARLLHHQTPFGKLRSLLAHSVVSSPLVKLTG